MKPSYNIGQVQNKLFQMAKSVSRILEEHEIPYMITFGSLLGAVRHGGFIPWDDDFDFFLFSDTYEKAVKLLRNELPVDCFVEDEQSEPLYFHGWAHVKDLKSEVVCDEFPQDNLYKHHGLSIDLYKCKRMKECDLLEYRTKEHIAYLERKLKHNFISCDEFKDKVDLLNKNLRDSKKDNSQVEILGINLPEEKMLVKDVFPLKKYKFNDVEFYGPNNADGVLTQFYGNYMELPPLEKRVPHYSMVKFLEGKV